MLDFYTEWWGGCIQLDAVTFKDPFLISRANDFFSIKVNLDLPENELLSNQYNVTNIPQNIFVNSEGIEIDRIIGYYPADIFLKKVNDILENKNTINDLENRTKNSPDDSELLFMLSNKYENVGEYNKAKNIYEKIININNNSLLKERATFQLAKLETYNNEINQLTQFIASYPDSENISECYKLLVKHYKQIKNEEKEIEIYKKWINTKSFCNESTPPHTRRHIIIYNKKYYTK